eukprot:3937327-Pyramimonas_sp.AAC.1
MVAKSYDWCMRMWLHYGTVLYYRNGKTRGNCNLRLLSDSPLGCQPNKNIPARPASDWSVTRIYPPVLRPIGPGFRSAPPA